MAQLLILVEGQTEERFVADVLRDHLSAHSVYPTSTILTTKLVKVGPRFKGGVTSWNQIKRDLSKLLGASHAVGITTLIDYYDLPNDVPGMADRPKSSARDRVEHVEEAIASQFKDRRFRPYLMLHEFEAMLFTNVQRWQHRFDDQAVARLKNDVAGLPPEDINETPQGAPSKRILRRLTDYEKVIHGPASARDIGLTAIRDACPHFRSWLAWAEGLGDSVDDEDRREEDPDDELEKSGASKRRARTRRR